LTIIINLLTSNVFCANTSGIIDTNTIWTLSNSPYLITSDIQVAYGVSLTIEPGVIVIGENHCLKIFGNLNGIGSESSRIVFNNVNIVPGNSVSSELFLINIQYYEINSGSIYRGSGAIYGSLMLKDSKLKDISYSYLWYPKSDCYIERNFFQNCGGLSVGTSDDVKVYIRNNVFYGPTTDYAIKNWASYGSSETVVEHNSFLSSNSVVLSLPSGYGSTRMTAINNYWGTTNEDIINSMIFDKNDDLSCSGYIEYEPFLAVPHPDTPAIEMNRKPTANAGTNQVICDTASLDGSGSIDPDQDSSTLTYEWQLTHRTNSAYNRTTTGQNPNITNLETGFYDVVLTVTDDNGEKSTDMMLLAASGNCGGTGTSNQGDVAPLVRLENGTYRSCPDGEVTIGDAVIVLRRSVGMITWE
jgi:hypothetical protein